MATIPFDQSAFVLAFPEFQTSQIANLQSFWDSACFFIDNQVYGCRNIVSLRTRYLDLMTAHLATLSQMISAGTAPALVTGSTIDKISVTLLPPPAKDEFQYWMNLTPYGQQLLALMQVKSVGGWYVGGSPQAAAFRNIGVMGLFRR